MQMLVAAEGLNRGAQDVDFGIALAADWLSLHPARNTLPKAIPRAMTSATEGKRFDLKTPTGLTADSLEITCRK